MLRYKKLLIGICLLFLTLGITSRASAAPENNPIYATIEYVEGAISNALPAVQGLINALADRVTILEQGAIILADKIQELTLKQSTQDEHIGQLEENDTITSGLINDLLNKIHELEDRIEVLEGDSHIHTPIPSASPTPTPTPIPFNQFIVSNNSWKYFESEVDGWRDLSFDDSSWENTVAPSAGLCPVNAQEVPTNIGENGALPMWGEFPNQNDTNYFRKHFFVPAGATGFVRFVMDDEGDLYINGNLALQDTISDGRDLTQGDISSFLHEGENILAMRVFDSRGGCQTVQFELELTPGIGPSEPQEVTFMNWFVPTTGTVSGVFDASGHEEFVFFWQCSPASLSLQYSDDGIIWFSQMQVIAENCPLGGTQGFPVLGKYYRVLVGPTEDSDLFVFAQGRFSYP